MCVELNDFIHRNYNFVQLAECHFLINKVENDCYESAERWILIFLKNFQFMICCNHCSIIIITINKAYQVS